jgi:mRNA-degrading endonuclease RelE of RelBE toxin-antitoxin system
MEIVALPAYEKQIKRLLSPEERIAMETALSSEPLAYPIIPRTGGFRKARWGRGNRGKSGGVRTIFYYFVAGETIYLQYIYAKNQKETLTHGEENYLRKVAEEIERRRKDG